MGQGDDKKPSGLSETQGRLSALFKGAVEGRSEKTRLSLTDARESDPPDVVQKRQELADRLKARRLRDPAPALRPPGPIRNVVDAMINSEDEAKIAALVVDLKKHDKLISPTISAGDDRKPPQKGNEDGVEL